jgi:hypothetical protein
VETGINSELPVVQVMTKNDLGAALPREPKRNFWPVLDRRPLNVVPHRRVYNEAVEENP